MPHSKIFMPQILPRPKPTARTQFIDCAANAADSSPAAQCGNAKLTSSAISAAVVFVVYLAFFSMTLFSIVNIR